MKPFALRGVCRTAMAVAATAAPSSFFPCAVAQYTRLAHTSSSPQQPHHHGEAGGAAAASPSPSSSSRAAVQQLYKSSHKGSGAVEMPKPSKPKALRSRTIPAPSAAEAAILGARSSCAEDLGPVQERALSPLQKRQLMFQNKAAFVLTPQALRRVKYLLSQYAIHHATDAQGGAPSTQPVGIRIGVRRRGCSGYSYTVNYYFDAPATAADGAARGRAARPASAMKDVVVEQEGVKVVVEADALFYVIGTEMDYVVRDVEEKFTFKNPNQKYSCGCEESFMPFDEDDMDD